MHFVVAYFFSSRDSSPVEETYVTNTDNFHLVVKLSVAVLAEVPLK